MFEFNEQQRMMEKVLRDFMTNEVEPHVPAMETGEMLPFELGRKMYETLGITSVIAGSLDRMIDKKRKTEAGQTVSDDKKDRNKLSGDARIQTIVSKEMSRVSPGFCMSMGATLGLYGSTVLSKGNADQIEKYALPVMLMDKVGAWAMTEPDSGSDAFACRTLAKSDGDYFVINGSKTFITNAPYADMVIIYAKLDQGGDTKRDKRLVYPFVMERDTEGLSFSKPMDKMGMCGSPTGQIFLDNVRVHKNQLLGDIEESSREQVKDVFKGERTGVPTMAWGIVERCLDECLEYATVRKQFGKHLGEYQLIQAKLAEMYVALENVRNVCFKAIWMKESGKGSWQDACAAKYYTARIATQVAMDAVQLMGGHGYMKEAKVERLARDAKLLEIGGGTNEIQLLNIARGLLRDKGLNVQIYQELEQG